MTTLTNIGVTKGMLLLCVDLINKKINGNDFTAICKDRGYTNNHISKAIPMVHRLKADGHTKGSIMFGQIDFSQYAGGLV